MPRLEYIVMSEWSLMLCHEMYYPKKGKYLFYSWERKENDMHF